MSTNTIMRLWPRLARWMLYGLLTGLVLCLAAAAIVVALNATPGGSTFDWPFRVTGRTNILVMGLDRTVSDQNRNVVYPISRTDTLIAVSVDPAAHQVNVLSIPRDTRAAIPGHGTDKINAAYAIGKEPLARRATENLTGAVFPYYITIRQRGFVHLIDAVGGVTVRIPRDLNYDDNWDGLHIHLKKGNRRLGGQAAIEYARFRHDPLGDIGRIQRQQQVVDALITELRRPSVALHAARILKVFREDIDTNLTPPQLVAIGWFSARLPKDGLNRETLPGRFGAADWLPNAAQDRAVVARMFYGMDAAAFEQTSVEVITSGAGPSAVADALARLGALGIRVVRISSVSGAPDSALVVRGGATDQSAAAAVASATRVGRILIDASAATSGLIPSALAATVGRASSGAPLTLVLGRDYDRLIAPAFTPQQ